VAEISLHILGDQ